MVKNVNLERLPKLSYDELQALLMKLNRIRYKLEEQEEFIRFYLTVHGALVACRAKKG